MPFKRLASKGKKPAHAAFPSTMGQPSSPTPHNNEPPFSFHNLTATQRTLLLQDIKETDLEWMINNSELKIKKFLQGKLSGGPVQLSDDEEVDIDHLIIAADITTSIYRQCESCGEQDLKNAMAKCRTCHYWFCAWHDHNATRNGRPDARFRFWKCTQCRKTSPGGPTLATATPDELQTDDHFEDSDNEMYA